MELTYVEKQIAREKEMEARRVARERNADEMFARIERELKGRDVQIVRGTDSYNKFKATFRDGKGDFIGWLRLDGQYHRSVTLDKNTLNSVRLPRDRTFKKFDSLLAAVDQYIVPKSNYEREHEEARKACDEMFRRIRRIRDAKFTVSGDQLRQAMIKMASNDPDEARCGAVEMGGLVLRQRARTRFLYRAEKYVSSPLRKREDEAYAKLKGIK